MNFYITGIEINGRPVTNGE